MRGNYFKLSLLIILILSLIPFTNAAVTQYNSTIGNDVIVKFNGTGDINWTAPPNVTSIQYLIVAGGGGGGGNNGQGGGGAGGMLNNSTTLYTIYPGLIYNITIGGGGAQYTNGENSSFGNLSVNLTAVGGGHGGGGSSQSSTSGGSGGGGGGIAPYLGGSAGISGQGNAGGNGGTYAGGTRYQGGGGGGATGVGGGTSECVNGVGGAGRNTSITGTDTAYAGGGGGHGNCGGAGAGGIGGGGAGYVSGTNDFGGGGGASASGGSGVIIIRYSLPMYNDTWYQIGNCFQLINESTNDTIVKCNTTGSYNWTFPTNVTRIQYLVVAGGGGGGGGHTPIDGGSGGGGGAGGLLTGSISRITSIINITVGSGGAGGPPDTAGYAGTNGTNSILGNLTINYTVIGGGGGAGYGTLAKAGGSGGGGNGQNTGASANGAPGTTGQGYRGGYGYLAANYSSGGGGGSGGAGENGTASINGAGGIGQFNSLIGIATRYAAGGGGGGGNAFSGNTTGASGGLGGGGTGGNAGSNGGAATNETGSGGGGAGALGTGGLGGTGIIILRYNVSTLPPITNFTMSNTTGVSPVKVNFTDDSVDATSWNWSFGDGNYSDAQYPNHTYTSGANYTVILNVSNIAGYNFTTQYVEVYSTPVAEFTLNTTSGISPLTVAFTDTSTGNPTNWNWTFGGANFSNSQNPTYTFIGVGNYTVILNASNPAGWDNATHYVNVTPSPPTASFTISPTTGGIPVTVTFTDTSTDTPTAWNWSFGDGMLSTSQNPSHTYANGTGTYTITLNASNLYGSNVTSNNFIATSHVYTADERVATKILDTQAFIVGGIYLAVGAVLVTLVAAIFGSKP